MVIKSEEKQSALTRFQNQLDELFPKGGVCAVLERKDGTLQAAAVVVPTGRLICKGARQETGKEWSYDVEISGPSSDDPDSGSIRVWIRSVIPHPAINGLWEAPITSDDGGERLLRINARS